MPSLMCFPQSGGIPLVSGNIYSGQYAYPAGGFLLKLATSGPGPVYVCIPNMSGEVPTMTSGGSLSSGGLADGWELAAGGEYLIPRSRLGLTNSGVSGFWQAGIQDVRLHVPAASSGVRLFWEPQ